jgi:ergothioneine biosynthesis protein EgtC
MCRFTLYLGPPVRLSTLLVEPSHSLIQQSFHAEERTEPLNGDGFGVGWYAPEVTPVPAVFRSVTPAWNNENLEALSQVVCSPCVLAHVRAATDGMPVNESNCHPFQWGEFLFMHNGRVGSFQSIRRRLLDTLSDDAFSLVRGSTDTEHLFAMFVDELLKNGGEDPGERMAECLNRAVWRIVDMVRDVGEGAASFLNVAVSDGDRAAVCRFTDSTDVAAESLYYISRVLYEPAFSGPKRRVHERSRSTVVSSERLTDDPGWQAVPPGQMVAVDRDGQQHLFHMDRDGLRPA